MLTQSIAAKVAKKQKDLSMTPRCAELPRGYAYETHGQISGMWYRQSALDGVLAKRLVHNMRVSHG
jgi:hypothetical protein